MEAARMATASPLLETSIDGAKGVLLNITGGTDLGLFEVNEAAAIIAEAADPEANIIFGAVIDETMGDEVKVTVIATGFESQSGKRGKRSDKLLKNLEFQPLTNEVLDIPPFLRRQ